MIIELNKVIKCFTIKINRVTVIKSVISLLFIVGIGLFYFGFAELWGGMVGIIAIILIFIALILINFIGKATSLFLTLIFMYLYTSVFIFYKKSNVNTFTYFTMTLFIAAILLCQLLFNIIRTSFLIAEDKKKTKLSSVICSVKFIYPIISYIVIIGITIYGYAVIYSRIESVMKQNALALGGSNNLARIDYFYFSITTFFTVGYGDILAQGEFLKGIVISEMIVGAILQAVALPVLLSICLAYNDTRRKNNKSQQNNLRLIVKPQIKLKIDDKRDVKLKRSYYCKRKTYRSGNYNIKR